MAWDRIHESIDSNGAVTMTPGYLSETITLGNDADSSTSHLPISTKSDATILVIFGRDLSADTYIQVEHSVDGVSYVKQGELEEDASVDHDDISKNMAKLSAIDVSLVGTQKGVMMMYQMDSHGAAPYTRFTVKANGQDESGTTATFYFIPHF